MTKTTFFRGALAALTLAAVTAGSVAPASADYYYRRGGWSPGAAAAVGAIGGLALGAAIAGSRPAYGYPAPAPVYAPPPARVYVAPEPECYVRRQRVWVEGWGWEVRRVRVCDEY